MKFVGVPFVAIYWPLTRITDRVSGKRKSKRKGKETGDDASDGSNYMGRGKSPVETIKVFGDTGEDVL